MICTSIGKTSFRECLDLLEPIEFAEIRLDLVDFTLSEIGTIFSLPKTFIATCRPGRHTVEQRTTMLRAAIQAGSGYLDLDSEEPAAFREPLQEEAVRAGWRLILSYHNFERTPTRNALEKIVEQCFNEGADIAKIACQVQSASDSARILSLYDRSDGRRNALLAIGMGKKGSWTRIVAPFLGAPFTFAAVNDQLATAGGQFDRATLETIYRLIRKGKG